MKAPILNEFNKNSQLVREGEIAKYLVKLGEIKNAYRAKEDKPFHLLPNANHKSLSNIKNYHTNEISFAKKVRDKLRVLKSEQIADENLLIFKRIITKHSAYNSKQNMKEYDDMAGVRKIMKKMKRNKSYSGNMNKSTIKLPMLDNNQLSVSDIV